MQLFNSSHSNRLFFKVSLTAMVLFMGIFFQAAWQYPVVDSFPLVERLLNPSFLVNDFYTNTFDAFSPRLILASCIAWVSETLDVHYTYIVAYGNILRIWLYAIALYLFFKQFSNHHVALIAFTLSSLSFLSVPFLPAWWPITFDFTASNVALTFAMFSWVMILKQKVAIALTLLTVAVIFHPLVGVHAVLIALILFFAYHGWYVFLGLFRQPTVYIAGLLFTTAFLVLYFSFDKVLADDRFIEINGLYRHAHHFIFSHMDSEKWYSTILMIGISLGLCFSIKLPPRLKLVFISLTIYACILTLVGYIFIEIIPTRFMVSFIPLRAFPILVPLIVLLWSIFAWQTYQKKNYLAFLILILPFLPYKQVGLTWFIFPDKHELILPILLTVFALIFTIITNNWPKIIVFFNQTIDRLMLMINKEPKPALFIMPIALSALALALIRFDLAIPKLEQDAEIYSWLKENTNDTDILLSELNAANNQKIRLLSNRAVVVSKDFPFNEKYYEQWYERYSNIYIERDSARGHVDTLTSDTLNGLMDRYNSSILIRTVPLESNEFFSLLGQVKGEKANSYIYRNNMLGAL